MFIENKTERFYSAVASIKKFVNNSNEKLDDIMQDMINSTHSHVE